MKKQTFKITGSISIILILAFGFVGCGGNNQVNIVDPTEEVIPTKVPTKEVIPTEEPTEEIIPTETPTQVPTPTEEIVEMPPIVGTYSAAGIDPDFNSYEGTLEITASDGVLNWNWLGREPVGIGLFQDDVVSVAWGAECKGVMTFMVQEDGVLEGAAAEIGIPGVGGTKASPQGEMGEGIVGSYLASGNTALGSIYFGFLDITRNGDVYDFYWEIVEGEPVYGIGIQRGNIVSVAFSAYESNRCMLVSYLIEDDGTLDGIWVYYGTTQLGTDVAAPET